MIAAPTIFNGSHDLTTFLSGRVCLEVFVITSYKDA